jgi:hypothetical protein
MRYVNSWIPWVVAVALGCKDTGPNDPAPIVTQVLVAPANDTLPEPAQTLQFAATARDSAGVTIAGKTFAWSSTATGVATVDPTGLATGVAAGVATIRATSDGVTGEASLTVLAASPVVASVVVAPANDTLAGPNDTLRFTATARDGAGASVPGQVFDWNSTSPTVATVDDGGLATGVAPGVTAITATTGGVTGQATLTVLSSTPGGTIFFQEGFEDDNFAARGWYDMRAATFATTTIGVHAGARALEVHFTPGATGPSFGAARHLFTGTESVFISYWVKYSANWVGSGHPYHPHEFSILTDEDDRFVGPAFTHLAAYVEQNYQNGGIPVLALTDGRNIDTSNIGVDLTGITENRAVAGCNGSSDGYPTDCYPIANGLHNNGKFWRTPQPYFLPNPGPGYKGDWHLVEAYYRLNTIQNGIGVADGVVRYWFDGELVIDHADVLLRTGAYPNMMFNQLFMGFHIGDGSPVDQTMWVDDLTVATGRP